MIHHAVSPPYGGPGRGIYQYEEAGGAGHGGHGGGDNEPSYGKPYGLNNTDLYLGGSTGIVESYFKAFSSVYKVNENQAATSTKSG